MNFPLVLVQAWDDQALTATAKEVMWFMVKRLDVVDWTPVKLASIAKDARLKPSTCSDALALLVRRGYLDVRPLERRSREFRLPITRRPPRPKVKPAPPVEQTALF